MATSVSCRCSDENETKANGANFKPLAATPRQIETVICSDIYEYIVAWRQLACLSSNTFYVHH